MRREDGANTVELVLVIPLMALTLAVLAHLTLLFTVRQATTTAVQEGLVVATSGDLAEGRQVATELVAEYSTGTVREATVTRPEAHLVQVTMVVMSPGLVPGLPRRVAVTQTGVAEQFLAPP